MDGDILAIGCQVLTTEGVCRDVIQGLLLQRIDRGELPGVAQWNLAQSLSFPADARTEREGPEWTGMGLPEGATGVEFSGRGERGSCPWSGELVCSPLRSSWTLTEPLKTAECRGSQEAR